MSIRQSDSKSDLTTIAAIGLLGGCMVTLLSVFAGVQPNVILLRALIGASIFSGAAWGMMKFLKPILAENDDDF